MRDTIIGIAVGGTHTRMGLFDGNMQLIAEHQYLTDKDATATRSEEHMSELQSRI